MMRLERKRMFKVYRYLAGELAPDEQARPKVPRLNRYDGHRPIGAYWVLGRWVYCIRWARI